MAGSYDRSSFNILGTSIVAKHIYIYANSAQGFPFLHISSSTCFLAFLIVVGCKELDTTEWLSLTHSFW